MRLAGQVEPLPGNGRGTPYAVTDWLRRGVGPLAAAARWERRNRPTETAPIGALDVEAAFLLRPSLLSLAPEVSLAPADWRWSCRRQRRPASPA